MENEVTAPKGMRTFLIVWFGQLVSLLGSGMTRFAITLWVWEQTQSATALALMAFFAFAPSIFFGPIAGAYVDRWDRKRAMMISDVASGLVTVALFLLSLNGSLQIWHLYIGAFVAGSFESFQFPAYSSAVTLMVDKENYGRASALFGLNGSIADIATPFISALLYAMIGLQGIYLIDIVTFIFAVATLIVIKLPSVKRSVEGVASRGNIWRESVFGFQFIWRYKSLFGLQSSFFFANLFFGITLTLTSAMILARTNNDESTLAIVSAALGIGGVAGGIAMSMWGGLKERRVRGVLFTFVLVGLLGISIMGMGQNVYWWVVGAFFTMFFLPTANASNQAIWQSKVPPDIQGKVFAARRLIASLSSPLAIITGGLLADYIFEPAMQSGGIWAGVFGNIVGTGAGAGMGLMFFTVGIASAFVGIISYSIPVIRDVEILVPDFDSVP